MLLTDVRNFSPAKTAEGVSLLCSFSIRRIWFSLTRRSDLAVHRAIKWTSNPPSTRAAGNLIGGLPCRSELFRIVWILPSLVQMQQLVGSRRFQISRLEVTGVGYSNTGGSTLNHLNSGGRRPQSYKKAKVRHSNRHTEKAAWLGATIADGAAK